MILINLLTEIIGNEDGILEDERLLTERQTQVLQLAVLGFTAKETARQLGISKNTVDEHLGEARRRAGVATKAQLIAWAVASGIVPYDSRDAYSA